MIQDEHRLVQAGPYRILRHPAYTGATVTIAGFNLFMKRTTCWHSPARWTPALIGYGVRIRIEERALQWPASGDRFPGTARPQLGDDSLRPGSRLKLQPRP